MELIKIGQIHSPYKSREEAPRQGRLSDKESKMEIFPDYQDAIMGLKEGDQIVVLYWGDKSNRDTLTCIPHRPGPKNNTGVFATRSPNRPNPIALCYCDILEIYHNIIRVTGLDALDKSPILDIKIYSKEVDWNGSNKE